MTLRWPRPLVVSGFGVAVVLSLVGGATARDSAPTSVIPAFSSGELSAAPAANWVGSAGNLEGQRYSSLAQITPSNVTKLAQTWETSLNAPNVGDLLYQGGGEATAVEYNGVLYISDQYGRVYAVNAANGGLNWTYEPYARPELKAPPGLGKYKATYGVWAASRGVTIGDNKVFIEEQQGTTVALNASTGAKVWSSTLCDVHLGCTLSQAPVYYDGLILGATAGGDGGNSAFVFALNANTGKVLWRFDLIPTKPGETGYNTWSHPLAFNGGGGVWSSPTVDPQTGLMYVGTGNAIPWNSILRGPGADYFTAGVLALHIKSGKLGWFYQVVHHDMWDADNSQQPILFNATYGGKHVQAIETADKDGLWYVLNAATGKPLIPVTETPVQQDPSVHTYATQPIPATQPLVPQTVPDRAKWKGLTAANGKPYNIGPGGPAGSFTAINTNEYAVTAAFGQGASSNKPAAVNPQTDQLFEVTTPGFSTLLDEPSEDIHIIYQDYLTVFGWTIGSLSGTPAAALSGTRLEAMNLKTGKMMWHVDKNAKTTSFAAGVLATPGLVWASGGQKLEAFSAATGQLLWESPVLSGVIKSPPMTYSLNGQQYVAIYVGPSSDLYVYSLPTVKP